MSDTTLALLITVLALLALAAWVPCLHAAETLVIRLVKREATPYPKERKSVETHKAA